jgi:BirA family biotin operon repressor/biotin-[acetyl-CoA-carboxylase] ligase
MTRFLAKPQEEEKLCAEWHLGTRHIGRRVLVYDHLPSTNDHAASLAGDPNHAGLVIVAKEQTAGRGQHGRTWQCPPGSGVLLSVLVFPPAALRRPALLTAWAAVSVCETILQAAGLEATIKWPNDVLLQGRKVCGILIEQAKGTVAGIGLNVNQSAEAFAEAGLPVAGSLACFSDRRFDCDQVALVLIRHLDEGYEQLSQGNLAGLEASWKARLALWRKRVRMECLDGVRDGNLREIGFGELELESARGDVFRVPPEHVQHLEPA